MMKTIEIPGTDIIEHIDAFSCLKFVVVLAKDLNYFTKNYHFAANYLLIWNDDKSIYVGKSENVGKRFKSHHKKNWDKMICICSNSNNYKNYIHFFEWKLCDSLSKNFNYKIVEQNKISNVKLDLYDKQVTDKIWDNILRLARMSNNDYFYSQPKNFSSHQVKVVSSDIINLQKNAHNYSAKGIYDTKNPNKFILLKGTHIRTETSPKCPISATRFKDIQRFCNKVDGKWILKEDKMFESAQGAATFVCGHKPYGKTFWLNEKGDKNLLQILNSSN